MWLEIKEDDKATFGRDYIATGTFLESIYPLLEVG